MSVEQSVFVSHSTRSKALKDFFVSLLTDAGFRPEVFDYGTPDAPTVRQAELIKSSHGFIGLLVLEENGAISPAVIQEIGIALAEEKPMQLFAFGDIHLDLIPGAREQTTAKIETYQPLSSNAVVLDGENARLLFMALRQFTSRMANIYEHKGEQTFFYKSFRIEQELRNRETIYIKNTISASTRTRLVTHTHEGSLFCDRGQTDGVLLKDDNWRFRMLQPRGTDVSLRMSKNTREFFRFLFDFNPPIEAGTDIKYGYDRTHENFFPYTLEELDEAIAKGLISHKQMAKSRLMGQDFVVTRPTENLSISMKFPPSYNIEEFEAIACQAGVDEPDRSESDRASQCCKLEHDGFDEVTTLTLDIDHPRIGHTYFLLYRPPSEQLLKKGV